MKKSVKFQPLTHNPEIANEKLIKLIESFPFDYEHPLYNTFFATYTLKSYTSRFWDVIFDEMEKNGLINGYILASREYQFFKNKHIKDPEDARVIFFSLLKNVLPHINPQPSSTVYQETPHFRIFNSFFKLIYFLLLPNGKSWKEFLSPKTENGSIFYGLFNYTLKLPDEKWVERTKQRRNEIEKKFRNEINIEKLRKELNYGELFEALIKIEKKRKIPEKYQTTFFSFKKEIIKIFGGKMGINFPTTSARISGQVNAKFGYEDCYIVYPVFGENNSSEEFEIKEEIEVVLNPSNFQHQLNEILNLYFGNKNLQMGADGDIRYLGLTLEIQHTKNFIQALTDKKMLKLSPIVDSILIAQDNNDFNTVNSKCRVLLEDLFSEILDRKKIPYNKHKDTLNNKIELVRANFSKIFKFPSWITTPDQDFDHLLLGLNLSGKLTNPPSHSQTRVKVSKQEAITTWNFVFMTCIVLLNFFDG